jgi:hypothetical protein
VSQSNGGAQNRIKQPNFKALECARLGLEAISLATRSQFFHGIEAPEFDGSKVAL